MDALSEVLAMLRVTSALSSRFEGRGQWSFAFPAYRHVKFGSVLSGSCHLWLEGGAAPLLLQAGDFYLLTNGRPFFTATGPRLAPLDGPASYRAIRGEDGVVRYNGDGDGALVSLASGRFIFENDVANVLLRQLPPVIHLPPAAVGSHALALILALLQRETGAARPGADVATASLATLVLVQGLRAYLDTAPQPAGWLAALADKKISAALTLMHAGPGRRWTLDGLAQQAGMSRTAFAARFHQLVGEPPMLYLNQWRMTLADTALRQSDERLAHIAARIGYLSDTAFSTAFKRWSGHSPGRYRALANSPPAERNPDDEGWQFVQPQPSPARVRP